MRDPSYLFADSDLRADLDAHQGRMLKEIDAMNPDEFLSRSPDDLADYFIGEFTVQVPVLRTGEDDITVFQREANVDVGGDRSRGFDRREVFYISGTDVVYHIPFDGDANLFKCVPSTRTYNPPVGVVHGHELVITITRTDHDAEAIKSAFQSTLNQIQQYLGWIAKDVQEFNDILSKVAGDRIEARRQKLLADRGLVSSLGYRLRGREGAPRTYAVPATRRKPPIERRTPRGTEPFKPEPELLMAEYEHILDILSNMVLVIERSPGAFKAMKEEELRQHFLVQLNGQYEGQATGETFNFEGKTDILIRAEGRNIFIAECKFWRGPKTLTETIDQLLGYATWRDTKTAILVFNRTKNLSAVLTRVPETTKAHPNFKRVVQIDGETRFRYVFAHRDDPNRELIITVLVFEVPS